jgi:hypothetical protein
MIDYVLVSSAFNLRITLAPTCKRWLRSEFMSAMLDLGVCILGMAGEDEKEP